MLTLETLVHASPNQVSCDRAGEPAILNLKTGQYYALDPVGATVWKLIDQPRSVASLRDAILAEYEVDAASCERDLCDLLENLAAEGLIEIGSGTGPRL